MSKGKNRFRWDPEKKRALQRLVPCSVDDMFHRDFGLMRGASLVGDEGAKRLYVSLSNEVFWIVHDGRTVSKVECLEGEAASKARAKFTWAFPETLVRRVEGALTAGAVLDDVLKAVVGVRAVLTYRKARPDGGQERDYLLTKTAPNRSGYLHAVVDAEGRLIHSKLLTGAAGQAHAAAIKKKR